MGGWRGAGDDVAVELGFDQLGTKVSRKHTGSTEDGGNC